MAFLCLNNMYKKLPTPLVQFVILIDRHLCQNLVVFYCYSYSIQLWEYLLNSCCCFISSTENTMKIYNKKQDCK